MRSVFFGRRAIVVDLLLHTVIMAQLTYVAIRGGESFDNMLPTVAHTTGCVVAALAVTVYTARRLKRNTDERIVKCTKEFDRSVRVGQAIVV
jgi:hypothetical protein